MIPTIIAAIIVLGLCMVGLAIGWLITGKVKLKRGTCGRLPKDKKKGGVNDGGDDEDDSCSLCGSKNKCDRKDPD